MTIDKKRDRRHPGTWTPNPENRLRPLKYYIYTCRNCGHYWQNPEQVGPDRSRCPLCGSVKIGVTTANRREVHHARK